MRACIEGSETHEVFSSFLVWFRYSTVGGRRLLGESFENLKKWLQGEKQVLSKEAKDKSAEKRKLKKLTWQLQFWRRGLRTELAGKSTEDSKVSRRLLAFNAKTSRGSKCKKLSKKRGGPEGNRRSFSLQGRNAILNRYGIASNFCIFIKLPVVQSPGISFFNTVSPGIFHQYEGRGEPGLADQVHLTKIWDFFWRRITQLQLMLAPKSLVKGQSRANVAAQQALIAHWAKHCKMSRQLPEDDKANYYVGSAWEELKLIRQAVGFPRNTPEAQEDLS
nr:hypothetical protein TEA_028522 [Ipomoea batatas]